MVSVNKSLHLLLYSPGDKKWDPLLNVLHQNVEPSNNGSVKRSQAGETFLQIMRLHETL